MTESRRPEAGEDAGGWRGRSHPWAYHHTWLGSHGVPPSEPVSCLMWEWAHWLPGRCTRLSAPQHDLAPITHTPGFTQSGDMEEPSPSDSQSTGQPLDPHSTYTGPTAWSGISVRSAAFQAKVSRSSRVEETVESRTKDRWALEDRTKEWWNVESRAREE
ncbi:unnamed protein product [Schistocephalus solidus]|uniref:TBD domain-containing protein n=1 Tax=Schistocephalus solidus TaxID=70667 RepID=A0A183TSF5_SCHSO|nr:unnamed protein product [Schistocephalus solidus]